MATDTFQFRIKGAGRAARDLDKIQRAIQDEVVASVRRLGRTSQAILRAHAPKGETHELERSVEARLFFQVAEPRATVGLRGVRSRGGFDYTDVTRFGHRVDKIRPRHRRALEIQTRGAPVVRASASAYHPPSDWVEDSEPELRAAAAEEGRVLGRKVQATVL